jgi:hypothetical protein
MNRQGNLLFFLSAASGRTDQPWILALRFVKIRRLLR